MHVYEFKVLMRLECPMCESMSALILEDLLNNELFSDMLADIEVIEISDSGCEYKEGECE